MQILESFLQKSADSEIETGPLLLVGSNLSMEEIETKNWSQDLKDDLLGFYFDIDRVPLSQQTSTEILELLFFHIDESMA